METQGPRLPVSFPEQRPQFVPPEDGKYLRISYFPNVPRWEGVTSGVADQGLFQIAVVWPKALGLIAPANVVAEVMAWFAKGSAFQSGTTRVKITGEPRLAVPLTDEGEVILPITIPWVA